MTTLNSSLLGTVNVLGGVSGTLNASQLGVIAVASAPIAVSLNASQLGVIAVVANGPRYQNLGNPTQLTCWSPCGTLIWNGEP